MSENKPELLLPRKIILKSESGEEIIHYSTGPRDIPDEVKAYAEKELNETEENKRKGVQILRPYFKKTNFPFYEESLMLAVLRCYKYNTKKSEGKCKKFCNLFRMVIKNLKKTELEKLEHIINDGIADCLPYTDKHGRPIYLFRPNMNLDFYNYDDMAAFIQAGLVLSLSYPLPTIKGVSAIIDCNIQSSLVCFGMLNAYRKYLGLEKTVPLRIGRIDFINENSIAHCIYSIVRPFLPSKINERIAFHGSDLKSLHEVYSPDILPEELGGKMGPVNTTFFKGERLSIFQKLRSVTLI